MPMSSPMMNRMLGFCCCCAAAGVLAAVIAASNASRPSQMFLAKFMVCFLVGCPRRADSLCPTARIDAAHASAPEQNRRCHESGNHSPRLQEAAAWQCRRQARHPLKSREVVRPLPARVPWALLRPPPFVRPRSPSDSCYTLVTETVPDYPSRGLRQSTQSAGPFGTICVVATGSLQIVAGKAQRQLIVRVL